MAASRICPAIQGCVARAMWWILPALISTLALVGTAQSFEQVSVPVQYNGQQIELPGRFDKPVGPGPVPAVIILHGCDGYQAGLSQSMIWAGTLLGKGYATLIIDSFAPRGYIGSLCRGGQVPSSQRVLDVYAAAYLLAGRPDIRRDKIAVLGFSHGAAAMGVWPNGVPKGHLAEAITDRQGQGYLSELEKEFQAAASRLATRTRIAAYIAFYPTCGAFATESFAGPVLILNGTADQLSPWPDCEHLSAVPRSGAPELRLRVYPGATHLFDTERGSLFSRNYVETNSPAASDSREEVRNFLRRYLR